MHARCLILSGVTALLLSLICACAGAPQPDHEGFVTITYCELRENEAMYDGKPIRVRGIWRHEAGRFSYIHSEPQCGGRSDFLFVGFCPEMQLLGNDILDRSFEMPVRATGYLQRDRRGLNLNPKALAGDGTVFFTGCIEQLK